MEFNSLNQNEQAEMMLKGITLKIEEMFQNAESSKKSGNLRAWANYLSVAADWADKLVKLEIEIRSNQIKF